jgi:hypothetical protein
MDTISFPFDSKEGGSEYSFLILVLCVVVSDVVHECFFFEILWVVNRYFIFIVVSQIDADGFVVFFLLDINEIHC